MSNTHRNAATMPFSSQITAEHKVVIPCSMRPHPQASPPYGDLDFMSVTLAKSASTFSGAPNAPSADHPQISRYGILQLIEFFNAQRFYHYPNQRFWDHSEWDQQVTIDGNTFNPQLPPLAYHPGSDDLKWLSINSPYLCFLSLLEASYIHRKQAPLHQVHRAFVSFDLTEIPNDASITQARIIIPWIWPDAGYSFEDPLQDPPYSYQYFEPKPWYHPHPYPVDQMRVVPAGFSFPFQLSHYSAIQYTDLFPLERENRYLFYTPENIRKASLEGIDYIENARSGGLLRLAILNQCDFENDPTAGPPVYEPPNNPETFTAHYHKIWGNHILASTSGTYSGSSSHHMFYPAEGLSLEITYSLEAHKK